MPGELFLLPRADKRVRLGHAWVFSNEVDIARSPLGAFAPGDLAVVRDAYGKPVGTAYVNPGALICARILTSDAKAKIDKDWWTARIRRALALREGIYPTAHYRAVYGESDGCPGLVVDRYGDVLVAQLNTAGIVKMRADVVDALQSLTQARGILLRSAGSVRQIEGIDEFDEAVGDVPDAAVVEEGTRSFPHRCAKDKRPGISSTSATIVRGFRGTYAESVSWTCIRTSDPGACARLALVRAR